MYDKKFKNIVIYYLDSKFRGFKYSEQNKNQFLNIIWLGIFMKNEFEFFCFYFANLRVDFWMIHSISFWFQLLNVLIEETTLLHFYEFIKSCLKLHINNYYLKTMQSIS